MNQNQVINESKPVGEQKTNIGLVEYCRRQIGRPYWYGCFGQKATRHLYDQKRKQYPSYYTDTDFPSQYGAKVHDCIGLVKGYFWTEGADSTSYTYCGNGFPDLSANMFYRHCKQKGDDMKDLPELPGVLVFMPSHVGVYIGDGWVIEARGHKYGVVKTKLKDRPWRKWALIPELVYIQHVNVTRII